MRTLYARQRVIVDFPGGNIVLEGKIGYPGPIIVSIFGRRRITCWRPRQILRMAPFISEVDGPAYSCSSVCFRIGGECACLRPCSGSPTFQNGCACPSCEHMRTHTVHHARAGAPPPRLFTTQGNCEACVAQFPAPVWAISRDCNETMGRLEAVHTECFCYGFVYLVCGQCYCRVAFVCCCCWKPRPGP